MLIWAEPFDQYSGNSTVFAQAGYVTNSIFLVNSGASSRTGNGCVHSGTSLSHILRRAITNPQRTIGVGCGHSVAAISSNSSLASGIRFENSNGSSSNSIVVNANNALGLTAWANGSAVGSTTNNQFVMSSYGWLEVQATFNSGTNTNDASVIVKWQGNTVLQVNGLNVNGLINFIALGDNGIGNNDIYFDDWIIWDTTGLYNNTFMGDRRLWVSYENGNSATQNWLFTGGATAWQSIINSPPNAAQYISSSNVGDISEFTATATGIQTTDVAAIAMFAYHLKTDAGSCSFRLGMNSNANVINSPSILPGTTGSYSFAFFERDPNGNIQWTKASVDAALRRVTRDS